MSKPIALRPSVRRDEPVRHPKWCEHGACRNDLDGELTHVQRLSRWNGFDDNYRFQVDLEQDEEYTPWDGQYIPHEPLARLHLRDLESNHHVPCHIEHEVPIRIDALLKAEECRRLAADLLNAADRIDAAGGAR